MTDISMGAIESRFADLIWQNEPITAAELAKRAEGLLDWKKTTSYTVLKRLCDKGIFQNQGGIVTSRLSRADYDAAQSEKFIQEQFEGIPLRPAQARPAEAGSCRLLTSEGRRFFHINIKEQER